MADEIIRPDNVAILVKLETTPGTDASPVAADAIPFEEKGYSYNYPFTSEDSNEATASLVAGAPLIVGQPAEISIQFRLKGANAAYSASVKPPQHALLSACGKRGLFTAAIAAAALTAGTTTSATLGTGFGATAQMYRGMPLALSVGPGAGQTPFITDYTAGKVATLTDLFGSALTTSTLAAIVANWTYAGTSPKDAAARTTDHPAATIYIYQDGVLMKFVGCRGAIDFTGQTAKPGFATAKMKGIFAGKSDASIPSGIALPLHGAPTLVQGLGGLNPAMLVNRLGLPIGQWSLAESQAIESPDDPNTNYGFGIGQIGERKPMLTVDPLGTLVATRDTITAISGLGQYSGLLRAGAAVNNRWAITFPVLQMATAQPGSRGELMSEDISYRALSPGQDANTRDGDWVLCFY